MAVHLCHMVVILSGARAERKRGKGERRIWIAPDGPTRFVRGNRQAEERLRNMSTSRNRMGPKDTL